MHGVALLLKIALATVVVLSLWDLSMAQSGATYHQIEGRVQSRGRQLRNIHVRLTQHGRAITETLTTSEGHFVFKSLLEGDYLVETEETDEYEATITNTSVQPIDKRNPTPNIQIVLVDLPLKASAKKLPAGVVEADVDLDVPKGALKRYLAGMEALDSGDASRAISDFQAAIAIYSQYYAARLELGKELRLQKRFAEAETALQPLGKIAPNKLEPRIEYGIVLLELRRREDAARELSAALELEESNWATHLYLGWALLETEESRAARHFQRALELDERKAARAHIALARIAEGKGQRPVAVTHLDAYLMLAPNASDAEAVRKLADRLRK
jgi:tetratricopeptide (TPR) repeat protein